MKLTPKQNAFVLEYMKDRNATQAAIRAGYSAKTAYSIGQENLTKPEIKNAIAELTEIVAEKSQLSAEESIADIARALRFDPRKLFNPDGTMKAITDLDDDTALCLTGIEIVAMKSEDGSETPLFVKKIKWESKTQARDQALRVFGAYEKDNKQRVASALDGLPRDTLKLIVDRLMAFQN